MTKLRLGLGRVFVSFVVLGMVLPFNGASAALVVNTNTQSIKALNKLNTTTKKLSDVFSRISKGLGINKAADDAAGLGMAESLDADYRNIKTAIRDANDGVSLVKTAEGAASEVANILKRMRELAVQSASETLADEERGDIATEFEQLKEEADEISSSDATTFDGTDDDRDDEPVRSALIVKAEDLLYQRLEYINDQVQDFSIDDVDDNGETFISKKWLDKSAKYLATAVTEVSRAADALIKNSDRAIKAAELKIKKLEAQRQKALKAKPKPKAKAKR
ncbi:MAG: hypothetical protein Q7R79_02540 [bacterium]|nr:hypothetical protein [bacterium]